MKLYYLTLKYKTIYEGLNKYIFKENVIKIIGNII